MTAKTPSDTPRVDEVGTIKITKGAYGVNGNSAIQISRLFLLARQLERELTAAKADIERLQAVNSSHVPPLEQGAR